jgi:hypothetical protein
LLRVEFAVVGLDVEVGEEIVEEMAEEFAGYATDDGREVEEGGLGVVEEVGGWADELRDRCYDADCPGEEDEDEETCSRYQYKNISVWVRERGLTWEK